MTTFENWWALRVAALPGLADKESASRMAWNAATVAAMSDITAIIDAAIERAKLKMFPPTVMHYPATAGAVAYYGQPMYPLPPKPKDSDEPRIAHDRPPGSQRL